MAPRVELRVDLGLASKVVPRLMLRVDWQLARTREKPGMRKQREAGKVSS
jgi:hypothetical protein